MLQVACIWSSRLESEAWSVSVSASGWTEQEVIYDKKNLIKKSVLLPCSKRDLQTQTTYDPRRTLRLRSDQRTIHPWKFEVWRDACSATRGFAAAVEAVCEKHFFFLWAPSGNDPSIPTALLSGLSTMKGQPASFSGFMSHVRTIGLRLFSFIFLFLLFLSPFFSGSLCIFIIFVE